MVLLAMAGAVMLKKSTEPEPHELEDRMRDHDREHGGMR
jgi:hypothetical protein